MRSVLAREYRAEPDEARRRAKYIAKVTRAKWEIRKNNHRFLQAVRDLRSAVRARRAAGVPPLGMIDAGLARASIAARCWRGGRSLTIE